VGDDVVVHQGGAVTRAGRALDARRQGPLLGLRVPAPAGSFPSTSPTCSGRSTGYHGALAAACRGVATCRYDGGAARRISVTAADMSPWLDHLSIPGNAKMAAAEWAALY
jgi:hypothetical protein